MIINLKDRIELSGFIEQDLPYQCPECQTELSMKNVIGFGDYPKGGYRASLKPNQIIGIGFECPKCFAKSCFHADETVYQLYLDIKSIETKFPEL